MEMDEETFQRAMEVACSTCRQRQRKRGYKTCQHCLNKASQRGSQRIAPGPSPREAERQYLERMMKDLGEKGSEANPGKMSPGEDRTCQAT